MRRVIHILVVGSVIVAATVATTSLREPEASAQTPTASAMGAFDSTIAQNAQRMIEEGRKVFRFDTFGDEAFWGDQLQLHKAIAGAKFGGIGPGLSPAKALELGLKVDSEMVPPDVAQGIKAGKVDLNDPASTLVLLKANAVVGVTAFANADGSVRSMGIQ
jgi:hypothetical protein